MDTKVFGVAVAGKRIGIFLYISGGLTAEASVGPGELRDVSVEVTYNPEDENSAKIAGSAQFVVPAGAGLRLAIQCAIGAGIPVVSSRSGLELGPSSGSGVRPLPGRWSSGRRRAGSRWRPMSG